MEQIITFFKILFFSNAILLTPEPIDINGSYILLPTKELNVITEGARLEIEISKFLKEKDVNRNYFRTGISDIIPPKSIMAEMYYKDKKIITLELSKGIGFSKEKIFINLSNSKEINSNMKFDKIIIKTKLKLESIQISWINYST